MGLSGAQCARTLRRRSPDRRAGWDLQSKEGAAGKSLGFHGSLYFIPMMIVYGGGRREEYCGLMTDDVIEDNNGAYPYLHIAKNKFRHDRLARMQPGNAGRATEAEDKTASAARTVGRTVIEMKALAENSNVLASGEAPDRGLGAAARAEGPWTDLALHRIGWRAFQDLCSQVCKEVLHRPVEIFREAQDGGQDAVFLIHRSKREPRICPSGRDAA
jgi:hypothetical protein